MRGTPVQPTLTPASRRRTLSPGSLIVFGETRGGRAPTRERGGELAWRAIAAPRTRKTAAEIDLTEYCGYRRALVKC
jgi:hypothetical protein